MSKLTLRVMFLCSIVLLFFQPIYAQSVDVATQEVTTELKQDVKLTEAEGRAIEAAVKDMLRVGADKVSVKSAVADLKRRGIEGEELKSSVDSMHSLVRRGKSAKEAGNIVSQVAHQAKREGLKGKDLANRVHAVVEQMHREKKTRRIEPVQIKRRPTTTSVGDKPTPSHIGHGKRR